MQDIFDAIDQYAKAYGTLEQLQRTRTTEIPLGDQKTGVIAEFFARIYAKLRFPNATFEFGSACEHAWDIKVLLPNQPEIKVQVKAVSAHSQTSRVSPIHPGWNQLWLMRLNQHLPKGPAVRVLINSYSIVVAKRPRIARSSQRFAKSWASP